jgi:hypothetical protein
MIWEPAEVALCEQLWTEGYSAAKIGERMGRSRNSIIRKVQKLCLPVREWSGDHVVKGARTRSLPLKTVKVWDKPPAPRRAAVVPPPDEPTPLGEPGELSTKGCKWPMHATGQPWVNCGHERHGNANWCAYHHPRASSPPKSHR